MPDNPEQLTLMLALAPRLGNEDFLVGASNELAWNMINSWPRWSDHVLILVGSEGSGKSHLASIWAEKAKAKSVDITTITANSIPEITEHDAVILEDLDLRIGDEAAFFHFLNRAREQGGYLLITARTPPSLWAIATQDLLSRLRLAPTVELLPPDDQLLRAVLVKLFLDRQLIVDTGVIEYLILRMERSFAKAREIVNALDQEALRRGRRITRFMVSDLLKGSADNDDT